MKKRVVVPVLVLGMGAALLVPAIAAAAPSTASVTIRHQVRGCHSWSVNGGPFAASHPVTLAFDRPRHAEDGRQSQRAREELRAHP